MSRFSLSGTYEFAGGYSATLQGGINELTANWIRPFGLTADGIWWSRDPTDSEDKSVELRFASPTDQRLTWVAGINYYDQEFLQSGSGGDAIWLCTEFGAPMTVGSPLLRHGRPVRQ